MRKIKLFIVAAFISSLACITSFAGEWKQDATGYWYQNDDSSFPTNQWFQDFDGKWYYMNESGYILTGASAPDGRVLGTDGSWVQPVTGEAKSVLYDINNWVIGDIWNKGFCDFSHFEEDGMDSSGNSIDIEYAYQIFCEKYKMKASYESYINVLPDEYSSIKTAWAKLSTESDKLFNYYKDNGIRESGESVDDAIFVQYRNAFTDYVYAIK